MCAEQFYCASLVSLGFYLLSSIRVIIIIAVTVLLELFYLYGFTSQTILISTHKFYSFFVILLPIPLLEEGDSE